MPGIAWLSVCRESLIYNITYDVYVGIGVLVN